MLSDIRVILWKEWQDFKRRMVSDMAFAGMCFLVAVFLAPSAIVDKHGLFVLFPPVYVLGGALMLAVAFYALLVSQMSFTEERAGGTLCMLLTTRLSPTALLIGKCMSLLIPCVLLSVVALIFQPISMVLFLHRSHMQTDGYLYSPLAMAVVLAFTTLYSSYSISSNAFMSLIFRDIRTLQHLSILPMALPVLAAYGCLELFGSSPQLTVYAFGLSLLILTLLAFLASLLAFRNEKVRLR